MRSDRLALLALTLAAGCVHDWDALRPFSGDVGAGFEDAAIDVRRDTGRDRGEPDVQAPLDVQERPDVQVAPDVNVSTVDVRTDVMDAPIDRGTLDTGPLDVGPVDAGPRDTGPLDTGPRDAGPPDMGPPDMGPPDMGPVPCPGAPMTCACSTLNMGGYCRPGESCTGGRCVAGTVAGSLVISEIMNNPEAVLDPVGEWFEVYNPGATPLDLRGVRISSLNDTPLQIPPTGEPIVVAATGYVVLGISAAAATNGGVTVRFAYGSVITLGNGASDTIVLDLGSAATEIDRVMFGTGWPQMPGRSKSLRPDMLSASANDNPSAWCDAPARWSAPMSDYGSPGVVNPPCP